MILRLASSLNGNCLKLTSWKIFASKVYLLTAKRIPFILIGYRVHFKKQYYLVRKVIYLFLIAYIFYYNEL